MRPKVARSHLGASVEFGVAEAAPELVGAFDRGGLLLCVDTYSAVESELLSIDSNFTENLWLGYIATLEVMPLSGRPSSGIDLSDHLESAMGDPQPQPSDVGLPPTKGDQAEDGDPQPQPSRPASPGGSGGDAADTGAADVDNMDDCEDVEASMLEQHRAAQAAE